MHFKITHAFDADPARYWKVFLDEAYNVALYDRIGVKERRVLERTEDAKTVKWSVRIVPKREAPAILKKVTGGDLSYTEISTYYRDESRIDVRVEPGLMKDRTKIRGQYTVTPAGPGRVTRTFEGDVQV